MFLAMYATWIAVGLVLGMLCLMEVGRRIGKHYYGQLEKPAQVGAIEGAVFALLGLLIAFTFSSSIARFEVRRELIVEEANDIGTAYLRIDLLPSESQPAIRQLFRDYLDSRLSAYQKIPDLKAAKADLDRGSQLQMQIWSHSVNHCQSAEMRCSLLLLPALNDMIDITTTRTMLSQFHPPTIIFLMLIVFSMAGALLAGYGMSTGRRSWVHLIGFSFAMALTVYVILD